MRVPDLEAALATNKQHKGTEQMEHMHFLNLRNGGMVRPIAMGTDLNQTRSQGLT